MRGEWNYTYLYFMQEVDFLKNILAVWLEDVNIHSDNRKLWFFVISLEKEKY